MDVAAGKRGIPPGDMRLRSRTGVAIGVAMVLLLCGIAWVGFGTSRSSPARQPGWTPLSHKVRIEVLNASTLPGAARVGTLLLRHAGLDVVQSRNAESSLRGLDRNRIAVRRGDTTGVGRIIEVLGGAEVIDAPDKNWLVDLTVILGRSFAPPPDRVRANQ